MPKRRWVLFGIGAAAFGFISQKKFRTKGTTAMNLRSIDMVISEDQRHWVGDGFFVRTMFSPFQIEPEKTSPFILMDYADPHHFEASSIQRGVGEHPHRGFETVTFAYQGEVTHRDSAGGGGTIFPGDVQWMTAGSGVVHEEFHSKAWSEKGGLFEMVQLWVNLKAKDKMTAPRYQALVDSSFPRVQIGNVSARLIAGELGDSTGAAKTFSPMTVFDFQIEVSQTTRFTLPKGHNTLFFMMEGAGRLQESTHLRAGQIALMNAETEGEVIFEATQKSRVLVLSGEPLNEPVAARGPFVMNTVDELRQAFADYRAGHMGHL